MELLLSRFVWSAASMLRGNCFFGFFANICQLPPLLYTALCVARNDIVVSFVTQLRGLSIVFSWFYELAHGLSTKSERN